MWMEGELYMKISNPINLHIGKNGCTIVTPNYRFPLSRKTPTMGTHYGFIVTVKDTSIEYPTEETVSAVGFEQGMIQVYEETKEFPHLVDVSGALIEAAYSEQPKQKIKRR